MRFPYYVFNPRHGSSWFHRASEVARYLLSNHPPRFPAPKPQDTRYEYVTLICRADLTLSRMSIWSLLNKLEVYPQIVVG